MCFPYSRVDFPYSRVGIVYLRVDNPHTRRLLTGGRVARSGYFVRLTKSTPFNRSLFNHSLVSSIISCRRGVGGQSRFSFRRGSFTSICT